MLFKGKTIEIKPLGDGIYDLVIDHTGEAVNTIDQSTLGEIREAVEQLAVQPDLQGLIFSSAKESFIAGADINEFMQFFEASEEEIVTALLEMHKVFNAIEDLPCPTVAAINGLCLGGGFELCLAMDYRVIAEQAKVGLPEVKLGIYPGWGGTVRLPRLIGVDNANEWICGGIEKRGADAFKDGAADALVPADQVKDAALDLVRKCISSDFNYQLRRQEKQSPIKLSQMEQVMAFESAKGVISAKAGPHYPAPLAALKTIQKHANLPRDKALEIEAKGFVKVAKSDVCEALVGLYLKDHYVKKVAKKYAARGGEVEQAAVLGAGIMGGGIAYQSASRKVPILMKDINSPALEQGLNEASKLLNKRVSRGRMDSEQMAQVLNRITPTLNYGGFEQIDLVVEAVVEHPKVKKAVLAEAEQQLKDGAVLASNTSTISITELASALQRPENFCGMHFFNPVHQMPLVEVIRGEKSSDEAIARTVAYAQSMGKTPVVVNDCPGFLVNRILLPYFLSFNTLLEDGYDFTQIDRVMEKFGWPMGPAYLLDVVGIDTAFHAAGVMAAGFPDRMKMAKNSALERMYKLERLGQKNAQGFYRYELDRKGKPKKVVDPGLPEILGLSVDQAGDVEDETIIQRLMVPLCIETVRCLEEGIVSSPAEADIALIYGIGFPPFRGGVFHYLDKLGLQRFCEIANKFEQLGPLYQPTETMKKMAESNQTYSMQQR